MPGATKTPGTQIKPCITLNNIAEQITHVENTHALKEQNGPVVFEGIGQSGPSNSTPVSTAKKYAFGELEAFTEYLTKLDFGPGQRDSAAHKAFLRAGSLGIAPDDAATQVAKQIRGTGGTFEPSKLTNQLRRAYEYVGTDARTTSALIKPPKAVFDPHKLQQCASNVTSVNSEWLRACSEISVEAITSAQILEHLYERDERIVVFTTFQSQGQAIYKVGCKYNAPLPSGGPEGVWFLVNPVDGQYHPNPRQDNKLSRRSEESVTSWRYLVLESDVADSNEWLSCLVQFPLRITAIYTSGGKSIHALVRLDATSKQNWDAKKNAIQNIIVTLGADEHALTAVRLSRLPATMRGDRPQELLYLNPQADGTPIYGKAH